MLLWTGADCRLLLCMLALKILSGSTVSLAKQKLANPRHQANGAMYMKLVLRG